jgi:RNA polymerase sigma factor (sigma-70 family)
MRDEDRGGSLSPAALAELVAAHRALLGFVQKKVGGDRALAEDILQDAWVRGMERGDQLHDEASAKAWMYRVLRNTIVDRFRRSGAHERALAALERELAEAPSEEAEGVVCECIRRVATTLPAAQARALQRIEVEGVAVKAFAEEEGLTASNAGVRVFRARKALRERIMKACGTCAEHGCLDCSCSHAPHDRSAL